MDQDLSLRYKRMLYCLISNPFCFELQMMTVFVGFPLHHLSADGYPTGGPSGLFEAASHHDTLFDLIHSLYCVTAALG